MLRLHEVRKTFGTLVAVDRLSLDIQKGEVFGLLGPNGAGKTTTVSMIVGLLSPDHGRVEIDGGGSPSDPKCRRQIGVAPQSLALYDNLSGEENLRFFGKLYGYVGADLKSRVNAVLDFVELRDRARSLVKTYSGGMKRRLNLAAAMIHDPMLLLFDEPTVGVDPQSRHAILQRIKELRREGRTVIYTTHYMEEAQRLCDRVAIMDHGRVLALDTVDALIAKHGGKSVVIADTTEGEVRHDTDDPVAEFNRLQKDAKVLRFRVERPDLESVFLRLTGRHLRDT